MLNWLKRKFRSNKNIENDAKALDKIIDLTIHVCLEDNFSEKLFKEKKDKVREALKTSIEILDKIKNE